jgi:hypothetical protein
VAEHKAARCEERKTLNDRTRPRKKYDFDFVAEVDRNVEPGHLDGPLTKASMPAVNITYRYKDPDVGPWAIQIHVYER